MKSPPLLLGTIVFGTAVGTLLGLANPVSAIPKHGSDAIASENYSGHDWSQTDVYGPDHYPLTTRAGTLAVEDLWKRRPQRMRQHYYYSDELALPQKLDSAGSDDAFEDLTDQSYGLTQEPPIISERPSREQTSAARSDRSEMEADEMGVQVLPNAEERLLP